MWRVNRSWRSLGMYSARRQPRAAAAATGVSACAVAGCGSCEPLETPMPPCFAPLANPPRSLQPTARSHHRPHHRSLRPPSRSACQPDPAIASYKAHAAGPCLLSKLHEASRPVSSAFSSHQRPSLSVPEQRIEHSPCQLMDEPSTSGCASVGSVGGATACREFGTCRRAHAGLPGLRRASAALPPSVQPLPSAKRAPVASCRWWRRAMRCCGCPRPARCG